MTSSLDHDARIWNVANGRLVEVLGTGTDGPNLSGVVQPNGRWVVTAGPASAGIWDVSSGDRSLFWGYNRPADCCFVQPGRHADTDREP